MKWCDYDEMSRKSLFSPQRGRSSHGESSSGLLQSDDWLDIAKMLKCVRLFSHRKITTNQVAPLSIKIMTINLSLPHWYLECYISFHSSNNWVGMTDWDVRIVTKRWNNAAKILLKNENRNKMVWTKLQACSLSDREKMLIETYNRMSFDNAMNW